MEVIEFKVPFVSNQVGVAGFPIEPNEEIWKRTISPVNFFALQMSEDDFKLDIPRDAPVPDESLADPEATSPFFSLDEVKLEHEAELRQERDISQDIPGL